MLIIMSLAATVTWEILFGSFICLLKSLHAPSTHYQNNVKKRQIIKIIRCIFTLDTQKKGCMRKNSSLITRRMVLQIKFSVMDIPLEAHLWKKKKNPSQEAIAVVYM